MKKERTKENKARKKESRTDRKAAKAGRTEDKERRQGKKGQQRTTNRGHSCIDLSVQRHVANVGRQRQRRKRATRKELFFFFSLLSQKKTFPLSFVLCPALPCLCLPCLPLPSFAFTFAMEVGGKESELLPACLPACPTCIDTAAHTSTQDTNTHTQKKKKETKTRGKWKERREKDEGRVMEKQAPSDRIHLFLCECVCPRVMYVPYFAFGSFILYPLSICLLQLPEVQNSNETIFPLIHEWGFASYQWRGNGRVVLPASG